MNRRQGKRNSNILESSIENDILEESNTSTSLSLIKKRKTTHGGIQDPPFHETFTSSLPAPSLILPAPLNLSASIDPMTKEKGPVRKLSSKGSSTKLTSLSPPVSPTTLLLSSPPLKAYLTSNGPLSSPQALFLSKSNLSHSPTIDSLLLPSAEITNTTTSTTTTTMASHTAAFLTNQIFPILVHVHSDNSNQSFSSFSVSSNLNKTSQVFQVQNIFDLNDSWANQVRFRKGTLIWALKRKLIEKDNSFEIVDQNSWSSRFFPGAVIRKSKVKKKQKKKKNG